MKTIKLELHGLHCASCIMNIEGALEDTPGVKNVDASYAKAEAEVTFDETAVSVEKILEIIKKLGYGAVIMPGVLDSGQ
ncbi:MAG: heavy metal-associated domain-containing protein [Candidatus Liptonbacteria bacterium]|nr:heavy metal-associated domain-containing protein [Candidatus Liptonbacteria bacterium]